MVSRRLLALGSGVLLWGLALGLAEPWVRRGQLSAMGAASGPWSAIAVAVLQVLGAGVAAAAAGAATGLFRRRDLVGPTRWIAGVAGLLAFVGVFAGASVGHMRSSGTGWWWLPLALVWSGAVWGATYCPWVLTVRRLAGRAALE
jgi:hypothetical protein